jgi:Mrp family chromosome partitioning ATPase
LTIDCDARVCHVDVSWESSRLGHRPPPDSAELGLVDVARGEIPLEAAVLVSESNPRLARLPLGRLSPATREGWARGASLGRILGQLDLEFDHVVLDCPPLLTEVEALELVRRADGYVLVSRYGVTTASQVRDVVRTLENVHAIGAVLNGYRSKTPRWFRRLLGD